MVFRLKHTRNAISPPLPPIALSYPEHLPHDLTVDQKYQNGWWTDLQVGYQLSVVTVVCFSNCTDLPAINHEGGAQKAGSREETGRSGYYLSGVMMSWQPRHVVCPPCATRPCARRYPAGTKSCPQFLSPTV